MDTVFVLEKTINKKLPHLLLQILGNKLDLDLCSLIIHTKSYLQCNRYHKKKNPGKVG